MPAEPLQELKLFIHSGAHSQPIGVNDKPLIDRFAGSRVRPAQGRQQLCKLARTPSPSTSEGELGPGSGELAQPEVPPRNCGCRAAAGVHRAAAWGCCLPKKLCSGPRDNGVFAASDTSGVCSPSLPRAESGHGASRTNVRAGSTSTRLGMSRVQLPLRTAGHYCLLGLSLFLSFPSLYIEFGGFCIFTAKTRNLAYVGKCKRQKKKKKLTNSHPYVQLRHFRGGWDLLKNFQ